MKYVGVPWVEILFCSYELFYFYSSCYFCVYFVLLVFFHKLGRLGMKWTVNGKVWIVYQGERGGVFLDFDVVVDGGFGLVGKGDVL